MKRQSKSPSGYQLSSGVSKEIKTNVVEMAGDGDTAAGSSLFSDNLCFPQMSVNTMDYGSSRHIASAEPRNELVLKTFNSKPKSVYELSKVTCTCDAKEECLYCPFSSRAVEAQPSAQRN